MTRQGSKVVSSGKIDETVEMIVDLLEEKNCLEAAE
jgi:hypothetical protein